MRTALPNILQLDIAGYPMAWLSCREAISLVLSDDIAWTAGDQVVRVHGGHNAITGARSFIDLATIMAVRNARGDYMRDVTPTLTNDALFRRDKFTCLYCGESYAPHGLTRDHVKPSSRGGADTWENVVTACRACNLVKADKTPEEAGMPLLALPFAPSRVETLLLANRRIMADQAEFIRHHVPRIRRAI